MLQAVSIPAALLAELRIFHRRGPNMLGDDLPGLRLRRLTGGRKNRVFAWDGPDGEVCLKLYRADNRDRAAREYQALVHLAESGITAAPQPLWHDPDPELPAVAMTMLPGRALPDLGEPASALRGVAGVLSELRTVQVGPFTNTPRIGSAKDVVQRLMDTWSGQLDDHADDPHTYDMQLLLDAWSAHGDAEILLEPAPRIFSRGDSNLLNWLWDGTDARVVDWEFAGYSDTAYDAAELVEHLSARAIDDAWWISLLPDLGINDENRCRRFLAAQRTVALRWLSVLWKRRDDRADEFDAQHARVRDLMTHDFV
ncbi:aminoglycoside phosphotransferase family protein [Amycolatopsis sp. H20-H5]|uniref:aminoglycoside phosphotransferase family protein n=1 Tax=Amycolatopsis sp. H20-H5 TaxID=3046309 RepID=UPI002DB9B4A4|nr:aminoglycoside phosphotransferase family protein [Amycolatopsis sp. H20-H5]MEC3974906.1 aminoglycoside phosphotransferase family protein [Amycolatopsis sp. H20-H5]